MGLGIFLTASLSGEIVRGSVLRRRLASKCLGFALEPRTVHLSQNRTEVGNNRDEVSRIQKFGEVAFQRIDHASDIVSLPIHQHMATRKY